MNRRPTLWLLLVVALAMAGCALSPHFEKPTLTVRKIEVVQANFAEQHLRLRLSAHNPNDRALPIEGIEYTVYLAGDELGHGSTTSAFTVPPRGDAEFDATLTTRLSAVVVKILPRLRDGGRALDYRVVGEVRSSLPFLGHIPFDQQGHLD
jgi:LEA14-like dessication related protein